MADKFALLHALRARLEAGEDNPLLEPCVEFVTADILAGQCRTMVLAAKVAVFGSLAVAVAGGLSAWDGSPVRGALQLALGCALSAFYWRMLRSYRRELRDSIMMMDATRPSFDVLTVMDS